MDVDVLKRPNLQKILVEIVRVSIPEGCGRLLKAPPGKIRALVRRDFISLVVDGDEARILDGRIMRSTGHQMTVTLRDWSKGVRVSQILAAAPVAFHPIT